MFFFLCNILSRNVLSFALFCLYVGKVAFSTGGFQAKYGDKMSSVLDITYKRPTEFAGSVQLSLLGVNAHLEGVGLNGRLSYLIGARQKSKQYLLQAQQVQGVTVICQCALRSPVGSCRTACAVQR